MNKVWKKRSQDEIKERVFGALKQNISYLDQPVLGIPGSFLDNKVFHRDAGFLKEAPFLSSLLENPNHIGCHTVNKSETFFQGTHTIERELLDICAVDILKGEKEAYDGYVASGGTEANIQAIWIYRNLFRKEYAATNEEITILCSSDRHYSMDKAANVLSIGIATVAVNESDRTLSQGSIQKVIQTEKAKGKKYFITICNMMTTMFGSVDDIEIIVGALRNENVSYKIHVDGAYGGFYYPFSNEDSNLTFLNEEISSFTLDAHKMAQAPYGTGIFLCRKNLIEYANTKEASYVEGEDYTLIGSRSGANAIAVWMILSNHGPFGWFEKVYILQRRAEWLVQKLDELGIESYRNPHANIVTINSKFTDSRTAKKYGLVPDDHDKPKWYKVVVMEHVTVDLLNEFIEHLKNPSF